ncbi:MAG: universal stress protein [Acidimicrobiales bacterium]
MGPVLCAIDFSDVTDAVLEHGATVARAFGTPLLLVHVAAGEPALAGYDKDHVSTSHPTTAPASCATSTPSSPTWRRPWRATTSASNRCW